MVWDKDIRGWNRIECCYLRIGCFVGFYVVFWWFVYVWGDNDGRIIIIVIWGECGMFRVWNCCCDFIIIRECIYEIFLCEKGYEMNNSLSMCIFKICGYLKLNSNFILMWNEVYDIVFVVLRVRWYGWLIFILWMLVVCFWFVNRKSCVGFFDDKWDFRVLFGGGRKMRMGGRMLLNYILDEGEMFLEV